jgi:hypothetical protein
MAKLKVESFGTEGVNTDLNPLELKDSQLTHAANVISDVTAGRSSIRKRQGLIAFTLDEAAGAVLGGVDLAMKDESVFGSPFIYIGRGSI